MAKGKARGASASGAGAKLKGLKVPGTSNKTQRIPETAKGSSSRKIMQSPGNRGA